jgi:hypothetical protein
VQGVRGSDCPPQRRGRRSSECKKLVWAGAGRCPHQRERRRCKECGGAGIFQHQRERSNCKELGGGRADARISDRRDDAQGVPV